ncbi:hypothetical protein BD560DRAFT_433218 [Blakeslea trispora]|nr:hypothetical protein BD560DRAFT_433218 [Blakeslea trispora]
MGDEEEGRHIGAQEGNRKEDAVDQPGMYELKCVVEEHPSLFLDRHPVYTKNVLEARSDIMVADLDILLVENFPEDFQNCPSTTAIHSFIKKKLFFTLKKAQVYPQKT